MDPGSEKGPLQDLARCNRRCHPMLLTQIRSHNTWHLDQQRKNIQSTKLHDDDQDTMQTPSPLDQGMNTHALYAATICYTPPTGKLYTDLTGRFPVQSSRGHKYILVAYNFDSNSIHVKPLKSRHDNNTIKAYEEIYSMLT